MTDIPVWKLFVQTYTVQLVIAGIVFLMVVMLQIVMMNRRHKAGLMAFRKRQAGRDGLTGFCKPEEFRRLVRNHLVTVSDLSQDALLVFDIDGMHSFNKEHGLSEGDRKITELAGFAMSLFRSSDIFCRMEGDLFAIYMKNITSRDVLERKCGEFQKGNRYLPASIGATMVGGREDFSQTYDRVMSALEKSKLTGQSTFTIL